ncbi:transposase domain-containing protein [Escherichia coli]|uniref:transposase domain-containing protein n=1 Tax=Escherichia coli TaxID=562 RepID=UPI003B28650E
MEPEKWLRYVIEHIQDWPANRVRDLLPWKVDLTLSKYQYGSGEPLTKSEHRADVK